MLRRLVLCLTATAVALVGSPLVTQSTAYAGSGPASSLVARVADEQISVSATEFRRHLFVAADAARLSDPVNTADLLAERVLQRMYALDAKTDPAAAADAVQALVRSARSVTGPAFDSRITRTMVLFQQAAATDRGPVAAVLQRATTEMVAATAQQISSITAATHAENALGTTGDTESRLLTSTTFTPTAVLLDSAVRADTDPGFARARDAAWAASTGVSITSSSDDLLQRAPTLEDNAEVQALAALRDRTGALETTGGAIVGTTTDPAPLTIGREMQRLDAALATTRESAEASTGPDPVDDAVPARAVEDARAAQTTLALQTGFLTGGTSASKDIVDQVGATAVQVTLLAMSFSDFSAGTIGRAALSGNALGVVMTLLPGVLEAAGVFGPSADDLMMTQLDNISQQMADFQNAVNGQFAQVFETLSTVSDQLNSISEKLDRAVIDIEQARVQVGQMYDSLARLQGSLDAVQNNILEALRNGANSQLRQVIDSALGYAGRNGSPLPLGDFNDAAAYLHTFATVTARHSPELNTDYPSFDVQNDANQLSTGIASNVHFLDRAPVERGWRSTRLSGTTGDAPSLANLDDFVLASRAYSQLMLENPRYVSAGYRRWLGDIQQLGMPLAALTSAISAVDTTALTHSTLLNQAFCARTAAAFGPTFLDPCLDPQSEDTPSVDAQLARATAQLTGTVPGFDGTTATPSSPLTVDGSSTFDPFVNSVDDASDLSDLWPDLDRRSTVPQCGAVPGEPRTALGAMERPTSLTPESQGVPRVFQWADRMGLGTLDVCYKVTVRSRVVSACQFDDQWMVVNLIGDKCAQTRWRRSDVSSEMGSPTTATYKYDDTAFVWTYTPADATSAPMYVQSLVRRGAATATAVPSNALDLNLPRGGYSKDSPQTYIDDAVLVRYKGETNQELTNVHAAPLYAGGTTAAAIREGWGDATLSTSGMYRYKQGGAGAIAAGSGLDQAIPGLDPKLGTDTAPYARTCTAAEAAAPGSLCQDGAGGTSILSLDRAEDSVSHSIDAELVALQGNVYRGLLRGTQTAGSATSGPLHDALVRLDGANAMLGGYLQLGASAALRRRDLTSLPGDLTGSKALVAAIKAEVAATAEGRTATAPSRLVTDTLDLSLRNIEGLDGLLPAPAEPAAQGRAAATPSTPGPVSPALQATNDQLTLTAVALGAPSSPTTDPPAAPVALSRSWKVSAERKKRYLSVVTATGGTGSYRWSRVGRLPLGMSGKPTESGRSYVVRGRPTKTGTYTVTLTVTDAASAATSRNYRIRVR